MSVLKLHTERLTLRPLAADEADAALQFERRNRRFLQPWEPLRDPEYFTLGYQRFLLEDDARLLAAGRGIRLWLFADERLAGSVSLSNIMRGHFLSCHLSYKLDEKETGRGYMTEALRAVMDVAFGSLMLHRVEANIMPRNERSLNVVKKLGFYEEGLARNYLKINGAWEDHLHMVLRNESLE